MNAFEKIKERLEEKQEKLDTDMWARQCDNWYGEGQNGVSEGIDIAIEIVNQVAEEFATDTNTCNALTETVRGCRIDCDVPSDYFEKIKEVRVIDEWTEESKIFKEVAEEYNDGWIPVQERLPKESGYYMACIYNPDVDEFDFRKTWFAHVDDYDMEESEWRELYDFEIVTAWQPLPKPYQPKGEK